MWEFIRKQEKEVVLREISHHCREAQRRVYSTSLAVIRKYNQSSPKVRLACRDFSPVFFKPEPTIHVVDKIYRTRENRAWCKEKGIRMSAPLGRPPELVVKPLSVLSIRR